MTRKHRTPEYHRNARELRAKVKALHRADQPVICWRGGGIIPPGTPWDAGHTGHGEQLAPEHRHQTRGCCDGNRREGGRAGALATHRTPARTVQSDGNVRAWPV